MRSVAENLDRIAADLHDGRFADHAELLALIDKQENDGRGSATGALAGAFAARRGTGLLVQLLEEVLTGGNIAQQSHLATLTARVRELEVVSERHQQLLKEANFDVVYSFVATLPSIASSAAAVVDDESVEDMMETDKDKPGFDAKAVARVLQQQLQDVDRQLRAMKDNMLEAYRKCQSIINSHGRMLAGKAFRFGVSDPAALARKVVQETTLRILSHAYFQSEPCDQLADDVLAIYASVLCNAQKPLAARELATKTTANITNSPQDFKLGLRIGLGAIFLCWSLSEVLTVETLGSDVWLDQTFRIFRALGDLLLLYWLWGVSLHVWTKYGIDYPRLLDMLPPEWGEHPSKAVWKEAADLSIVYCITFIIFCKVLRGVWGVPGNPAAAHLFPVLLLGWFLYRFLFPWKERKRAWFMLWRVIAAPAFQVTFCDGIIGDILTSTVRVCIDLAFAFGYTFLFIYGWTTDKPSEISGDFQYSHTFQYTVIPFLTALPLWLRFMQTIRRAWETDASWPHLGNSLKYATGLVVSMFAAFRPELRNLPMWILAFGVATIYQFLWDIFQDWDVIHFTKGGRPHLRRNRLFGSSAIYYFIIVFNFLLRFLWAATLLPESRLSIVTIFLERYFHSFIAAAEIVRRIVWGFLRLENEQLQVFGTQALTTEAIFRSRQVFTELRPHEMSPMEIGSSVEAESSKPRGISNNDGYDRLDHGRPTTMSDRLHWLWWKVQHSRAVQLSLVLVTGVVILLRVAASAEVPTVLS